MVSVPDTDVKKKVFQVKGKPRYAVVAKSTVEGTAVSLTKFVSKVDYDKLTAPMA